MKNSELNAEDASHTTGMRDTESDPVTEYVRFLIAEHERDGGLIKELATRAGYANGKWSMISQIKTGSSNASFVTAERLARAFGYPDVPAFVDAAFQWWRSEDRAERPTMGDAHRTEAMRIAKSYGVTDEQISRALRRWEDEADDLDMIGWLAKFHAERGLDGRVRSAEKALDRIEASEKRTKKKHARAEWKRKGRKVEAPTTQRTPEAVKRKAAG